MIQNEQQYFIAKQQRNKFKETISKFWTDSTRRSRDDILAESELNALFSMYDELSEEIREYKYKLRVGKARFCKSYIEDVVRSESHKFKVLTKGEQRILHVALGLATEAGEFADIIKKMIFYGALVDCSHLKEELGDVQWYVALGLDVLDSSFEEIQTMNIAKLKARYPEKFTEEKALNRNLEKEKKALEKG